MKMLITNHGPHGVIKLSGYGSKQLYCANVETAEALALVIASLTVAEHQIHNVASK